MILPQIACSSAVPAPAKVDDRSAYPDVVFEGNSNAIALGELVAAPLKHDAASASYFDAPANNAEIPGTPIQTFKWHDGGPHASLELLPAPRAPHQRWLPFYVFSRSIPSGWHAAFDVFTEGVAHASTGLNGKAYLLSFRTLDTDEALFRVFTTNTSYTPDAKSWAKLATNLWSKLKITSATFSDDALVAGPVEGETIQFCAAMPK
jgi:hypothetical protein